MEETGRDCAEDHGVHIAGGEILRILFAPQSTSGFAKRDLAILQSRHQVEYMYFRGLRDILSLLRGARRAHLIFCWFGKLQAFFGVLFSRILGKYSVVVSGGDEVAFEPEIRYGMFSYWWKKWCPMFVFHYADLILSVSEFNHRETIENARANSSKVKLLYHGFDDEKWKRMDGVSKETLVLTVARVTHETFRTKGLGLFVMSAALLPDIPFVLVGPWHDGAIKRLREIAPPNVTFRGGLYGEDLVRMYSRARVYVQASVHESFGCSVAEAMLCECVPVVSRRAALPEVVGDCGFYCDDLNPQSLAGQIHAALEAPDEMGRDARKRIEQQFPLTKRREKLLELIVSLSEVR